MSIVRGVGHIAELETMVFGRKKRPKINDNNSDTNGKPNKSPRNRDSFKRDIPGDESITFI